MYIDKSEEGDRALGAWMRHCCWESRQESESVGTSGRKGGGYTVAFASRMGTLGLRRWGVGPVAEAWPAKGLRRVAGERGRGDYGAGKHLRPAQSGT